MAIAEEWYADLPREILGRAYNSNGELAWARSDAIWIVEFLQKNGFRVVDIETWLPTRPGPTPLIDDWDETRGGSALAFVQTFAWEPLDEADRGLKVHFTMIAVRNPATAATVQDAS